MISLTQCNSCMKKTKLHIDNGLMNVRECNSVPDTPLKLMEMSVPDNVDRRATLTDLNTYDG